MNLSELIRLNAERAPSVQVEATRTWARAFAVLKNEGQTTTLVVSALGQFVLGTQAYDTHVRRYARGNRRVRPTSWSNSPMDVKALVMRTRSLASVSEGRAIITVFESGYPEYDPSVVSLASLGAERSELTREFEAWLAYRSQLGIRFGPRQRPGARLQGSDEVFTRANVPVDEELVGIAARMPLLVCAPPEMERTVGVSPAHAVHLPTCIPPVASVGVYATDRSGVVGVTTALHAVKKHQRGLGVMVNGCPGSIVRTSVMSDGCFVSMSDISVPRQQVLRGPDQYAPRIGLPVQFEGITTSARPGPVSGQVAAVDTTVSFPMDDGQQRVYTDPITSPGDSGAALISMKDDLIGFAYERTAIGSPIGFSAWQWGWRVFSDLDLVPFN